MNNFAHFRREKVNIFVCICVFVYPGEIVVMKIHCKYYIVSYCKKIYMMNMPDCWINISTN